MARKIYYKIIDNGVNKISEQEWESILRLQNWYNSEFIWSAGKLGFKMFAVFPDVENTQLDEVELWKKIIARRNELRSLSLTEYQVIHQLEIEGLVIAKKGGYIDGCLASGFTRVAANEFNAYLVCEFLLKASLIVKNSVITIVDEGNFIKPKKVKLSQGGLILPYPDDSQKNYFEAMIENRHVFSIVDSIKYDEFPAYQISIAGFNNKTSDEKESILHEWNWLGFDDNYDRNGDDIQGLDLNKKVMTFCLEKSCDSCS
jgi:hypothetical protein